VNAVSTEWIQKITVKPDGVYLFSKNNNDKRPYQSKKCYSLTEVHSREGRAGLDREVMRMLREYAVIRGHHPSVERYRPCLSALKTLEKAFIRTLGEEYAKLTPADKATAWSSEERQTDGAKAYTAFRKNAENELYTKLAALAKPPERNRPARDAGAR
jgi:hypothetical protein